MTVRWQVLTTRSRYSSWARAGDVDLEAVNMAAELQPDQSTITPRTNAGPYLFPSASLLSAQILLRLLRLRPETSLITKIKLLLCPLWHTVDNVK